MANGKIDISAMVSESIDLYKENFGLICVASLVAFVLGAFTCGILLGPLMAGLTLIILRVARKEEPKPEVGQVFKGFDFFLQSFLLTLVIGLIYVAASFVPFVGGLASILLAPLVMFAMCLLVDKKMEFWPAILASYEKAKNDYLSLLVLALLASLMSGIGAILCGIGVFLTLPFSVVVSVVAYRHLFEEAEAEAVPAGEAPVEPPPVAEEPPAPPAEGQ
jgi:uncharacterized membrane protein